MRLQGGTVLSRNSFHVICPCNDVASEFFSLQHTSAVLMRIVSHRFLDFTVQSFFLLPVLRDVPARRGVDTMEMALRSLLLRSLGISRSRDAPGHAPPAVEFLLIESHTRRPAFSSKLSVPPSPATNHSSSWSAPGGAAHTAGFSPFDRTAPTPILKSGCLRNRCAMQNSI